MRLVDRLLAIIVAFALVVGGALGAVEVALGRFLDRGPWLLPWDRWYDSARRNTWSNRSALLAAVLLAVVGLSLVVAQLWRRRPQALPLQPRSAAVRATIDRKSLERGLVRAAGRVDGITAVTVRLRRRRLTLGARTDRRLLGDLRARVTYEADAVLAGLQLQDAPQLKVTVRSRRPAKDD